MKKCTCEKNCSEVRILPDKQWERERERELEWKGGKIATKICGKQYPLTRRKYCGKSPSNVVVQLSSVIVPQNYFLQLSPDSTILPSNARPHTLCHAAAVHGRIEQPKVWSGRLWQLSPPQSFRCRRVNNANIGSRI